MQRLILLVFLIFLAKIDTTAQWISGKITNESEAVVGATIQVVNSSVGAVADANGYYQLELTQGEYELEVRAVGMKPLRRSVSLIDNKLTVNFALQASSLGLDEIVITGTMQPTFISDSPIKVDVVTADYLNTFTPAAASSIIEGVKLVNGVQEVVACGVCFTNSISINGLPGPYTAILMDGTPIYGNLASVYGLNGIPSMIIDRFEVIKGPSSTLYGSEAVAGVINIITKDPSDQPSFTVDIMGTSHLESFGNIAGTVKTENASGFIGLNYAYINDFDDDNRDGFADNINMDRYSLFTKWDFERKSNKKFTLAAKYFYEDRRNGVEEFLENRNYRDLRGNDEIYGESIYTSRAEVFGTYQFNTREELRVDYSFTTHFQDSFYGSDFYKAEQHIGFANLIWEKSLGNHKILTGITNRIQSYDDNTVATEEVTPNGIVNARDDQYIPGIFIQDEWEASDKLTILSGARVDHYQAHGAIFSPRLNLKYKLGQWTSLRTNFGTGFRIVNLFTEDHAFVSGQRSVEIVGDLRPESSYNGSINLNHVYTAGNSQGMIDIDAYYTYFTNKIIPDYEEPGKIIYANSNGHAVTKGIGLNINHDFQSPLSFNLGFNWQEVTQTEPDENGNLVTSPIEFAQEFSGVFTANYEFKKANTSIGYTARVTGPMRLPEVFDLDENGEPQNESRPTTSDMFSIHNIQITKIFSKKWTLYGGIQNLFDYRQPITPLVGFNDPNNNIGFSDAFDTSYTFAPINGREVYVGFIWTIE